jgi:hypothetical protein
MKKMKTKKVMLLIVSGLLMLAICGIVLQAQTQTGNGNWGGIMSPMSGDIVLKTELPEAPATMPMYKVIDNGTVSYCKPDMMHVKKNLPSEKEATGIAKECLEKYGGVPKDAVLTGVETNYLYGMNTKTGEVVEEHLLSVDVKFEREINGMPVVGAGGEIDISLGEDGELLFLSKCWRSLEYAGEVKIIPASEAFEKFKKGELIQKPMSQEEAEVTQIKLGYYAEAPGEKQEFYEPTWIFYTKDKAGDVMRLCVNAVA